MDGFAVRAADTARRAADRGDASPPAAPSRGALEAGEAIEISTGGVVPDGADAVVPIERVAVGGDDDRVPERRRLGRQRPDARRGRRAGDEPCSRPGRPAHAGAARRARGLRGRERRAAPAAPACGDRGHRHGAAPAGRDARSGRDLRVERRHARRGARRGRSRRRAARGVADDTEAAHRAGARASARGRRASSPPEASRSARTTSCAASQARARRRRRCSGASRCDRASRSRSASAARRSSSASRATRSRRSSARSCSSCPRCARSRATPTRRRGSGRASSRAAVRRRPERDDFVRARDRRGPRTARSSTRSSGQESHMIVRTTGCRRARARAARRRRALPAGGSVRFAAALTPLSVSGAGPTGSGRPRARRAERRRPPRRSARAIVVHGMNPSVISETSVERRVEPSPSCVPIADGGQRRAREADAVERGRAASRSGARAAAARARRRATAARRRGRTG